MANADSCPMTQSQILDRYFLEHRAKLIDLAAFLDRVDRAAAQRAPDHRCPQVDPRLDGLRNGLPILIDGQPDRAKRILQQLSDPTTTPIPAATKQGAVGAYTPLANAGCASRDDL